MKLKHFEVHKQAWKSLRKILKMDRQIIFTSFFEALLTGIYPYLSLYMVNIVIDALLNKKTNDLPRNLIILILSTFCVGVLIDILNSINEVKLKNVHYKLISMINEKSMTMDYEEMEKGDLLQKLSDARYVVEHLGGYDVFLKYYTILLGKAMIIGFSLFMIVQMCFSQAKERIVGVYGVLSNPFISLLVIIGLVFFNIVVSSMLSKKAKIKTAEGYQKKMSVERSLNYYVDKVFSDIRFGKDIRIFQMADYILSSYTKRLESSIIFYNEFYDDVSKNKESFSKILIFLIQSVAYVIIIIKVYAKSISIGTLSRYVGVILLFHKSIGEWIEINQKISLQVEFIKIFDDFLDLKNNKESGNRKIQFFDEKKYVIEFHNVSYRYENAEQYTLKNISCRFDFCSTVGIVGCNGAGKTTFVKLLTRLYDPTEGYITLNGINIKEYDYKNYLSLFSVVFQDYQLFAFPLDVNISTDFKPNGVKVDLAIREVGLTGRVEQLSAKAKTPLFKMEKSGVNFSGGEGQKIAIARAIYKNAPMVILDEPTAALDPESEYEIFQRMSRFIHKKSGIFISHRMGSCRFCNEILVFDKGTIIQRGNHEQLVQDRLGLYYKLYFAQAKHYG